MWWLRLFQWWCLDKIAWSCLHFFWHFQWLWSWPKVRLDKKYLRVAISGLWHKQIRLQLFQSPARKNFLFVLIFLLPFSQFSSFSHLTKWTILGPASFLLPAPSSRSRSIPSILKSSFHRATFVGFSFFYAGDEDLSLEFSSVYIELEFLQKFAPSLVVKIVQSVQWQSVFFCHCFHCLCLCVYVHLWKWPSRPYYWAIL